MASKKSTRTKLLENVNDLELPASTAIWRDDPASVKETPENVSDGTSAAHDPLLIKRDAHTPPSSNLRRSHLTYRHLVISLMTSVVIGLLVLWVGNSFYEREIAPRLATSAPATPAVPAATGADAAELARAEEKIAALQQQLDVIRREQLITQQSTRESLERISGVLNNPQLAPKPIAPATDRPGEARMADAAPTITPTQAEFIQIKERNRLTQYADEAIATGLRKPLAAIVEYLRDPDSKHLHEAAQAEYMRVVRSIQFIQRDDPGYRLPVSELFKGQKIREEADVKPEELLKLLADYQQPWEVRVRVCFLLLGSAAPETNAKLIAAIKDDPSLEVAKHAQLALEQRVKRRFRIFDIPAIEAWWKSQGN